jgi:hypothetical protein
MAVFCTSTQQSPERGIARHHINAVGRSLKDHQQQQAEPKKKKMRRQTGGNVVKDAEARQERARTAWLTIYGEKGEGEAGIRVPQFALADNYIKR